MAAPSPSLAAPPKPKSPTQPAQVPEDHEQLVDMAIDAWRRGEWTEVRDLLEPLLREHDEIADPLLREASLRYLAEATLYDQGLTAAEREELARSYIDRLLDHSSSWEPPSGLHGAAFYKLAAKVRSEREAMQAAACKDQLLACEADLTELRVDHRSAIERAEELQVELDADIVQRVDVIQRNRGLALIPLGVGHFTNGKLAIGGAFLAAEVVIGGIGLGLLVYRSTALNCTRTKGFQPASLDCPFYGPASWEPARRKYVKQIRDADQAMAIAFVGVLAFDLILAQVLFEPYQLVDAGAAPRSQLDQPVTPTRGRRGRGKPGDEVGPAEPLADPDAEPPDPDAEPEAMSEARPVTLDDAAAAHARERWQPNATLRVRPAPTYFPGGAGLGVRLDF